MSEWSQTSEKLMRRLIQLWDDEEFVVGTMSDARTEEERTELLKFMETYDIQPGDGMYLAPEDSVAVW